jgi:zinc protease
MAEGLQVQTGEVDGVPMLSADIGEPLDTLCLLFRVGHSDEPFTRIGLTHLVEHLALNSVGPQPYMWNGFVDLTMCAFYATGRPDEMAAFAGRVCATLANLPAERLESEIRVLRTEAMSRSRDASQTLLWYRFGAQAFGLSGQPEWALWTAKMPEIQAWADGRFTRRNAALWYVGRPPAELRLPLPDGEWHRPVPPRPVSPLPLPSASADEFPFVALGSVCRRSPAMTLALNLIGHRTLLRLRMEEGVAREVQASYMPLTADVAHVSFSIPVLTEHADQVRAGLVEVTQQMAGEGPEAEELERAKEQGRRSYDDRRVAYWLLDWQARERLVGGPGESLEELRAGLEAVTPEAIRAAAAEILAATILLVPSSAQKPGEPFAEYPIRSTERIGNARVYACTPAKPPAPTGFRLPFFKPAAPPPPEWPRLLIGSEGVSLCTGRLDQVTVKLADCAGYLCGTPGTRTVVGLDGFYLRIAAADWIEGEEVIKDLDATIPKELWIEA